MLNTKSIMRDRPRTWTFAAITAVFVAVPALTLACGSVFNWHIQQPVYWQSSVELLAVLTAVYIAASRLGRRTRLYGILAVTWLYGRHQGFDLSLAVVFIYLQGISSLGHIFCGRLGLGFTRRSERFFGSLLMGFALWVASIYISSALGLGSSTEIRWLAVLLLGGSVIFDRDRIFLSAVAHEIQNSRRHAAFYAVIITMILAAFAKTTVASDYDSLWYGMNGEQVLTAAGSMFTSEGLVTNLAAGTRVIGEPDGWWLPVRYEPFSVLRWANPAVSSSLSNFREFLARGGIQYIIASRTSSQESHNLQDWLADLESRGEIEQALVSEKFVTWRITTPPIAVDNSSAGGMWVTLPQPADCSAVGLIGKVAAHWKFWGASSGSRPGSVAIFVKSADATEDKPWTGGPATGSEETGAWVSPGMQFIAKEQPAGRTIASVTVPSDACKQ
jgi:hypothetical protein